MDSVEKLLQVLLDPILDSTGSDADRREISRLIDRNPELMPSLIEQLRIHSFLQWQCHEIRVCDSPISQSADELITDEKSRLGPTIIGRPAWTGLIAATFIIVVGIVAWWQSGIKTNHDPTVAEIVDEKSVVWSDKTTAVVDGRAVRAGRLEFVSGELTLRFRSGATIVFRGAASVRIETDMLVLLDQGHATAQVPEWAKGFTIKTADVEVVDLGTQFGVMARADHTTDVVIFEGQVDVKPTGGSQSTQRRLNQGEAARINSRGAMKRIVDVRGDVKGGWSTVRQSDGSAGVFRSIRDNIPPSDGSRYYYYQISPGALQDDAWAYVDRHPHQWNGLTAAGLPTFLLGADYVRTFNDYRYIQGFEIVVQMARPADLYVFFDDRVPIPDWLRERFEYTHVKIGLDEGPWEGIPHHRSAVGAGNSIDNVFSVWRRRCKGGESVALGAVGDSKEARAMYGIAATPNKRPG
jgi:hypothetical protein